MTDINNHQSDKTGGRLLSLDTLRGFDMLWIAGGSAIITTLADTTGAGWLKSLSLQMDHVPWIGFHFFDLIFPLFMFISGVAIPLSVKSALSKNLTRGSIVTKALKRMIILIILGFLYNGDFRDGFSNARYVSVLGQIGVAYFFASVIYLFSGSLRATIIWLASLLACVSILQLFVPVPGAGAGVLTPEGHINGYIDRMILPGRLAYGHDGMVPFGEHGFYDALGLLSIVSAIGITLMGIIAGKILQDQKISEYRKTLLFSVTGVALILSALLISPVYPVIKACWTTTYNLLAGGISFLLMALFYLVVDVWKSRKWTLFFRVIGMNSIFIYLFVRVIPVEKVTTFFTGWITIPAGIYGGILTSIFCVLVEWLLLYYMYKKKIFIKV